MAFKGARTMSGEVFEHWDWRVSKSNQLHGTIFWFFLYKIEAYSIGYSKMMGSLPEVLMNFHQLSILKLNWFIL